ncbi:MAG: thioredoxin domain-containing protein [Ardenticatenaceae bacterium]|nr:thioredoxin domain-containing protein [Ardenticatenaceae bacterium]
MQEYVQTGKVKVVFWPVLNHGDPSVYSTLTAECVGQQSPDLFWQVHKVLFEKQSELWRADRDYYVQTAVSVGADQATFETCYDGTDGITTVLELDDLRRQRGIYSQPTFDINGNVQGGAPSYDIFAAVLDDAYATATP